MPDLVVVGCPSMDQIVVGGEVTEVPGGAGFNTALAARGAGIEVGLVAAIPRDMSRTIAAAFGPGGIDRAGLVVRDGVSPSFHISYDDDQIANYLGIELGVESTLRGDDFPDAWLGAKHVHVAPLGASAARQLEFVRRIRDRGFRGSLSAGGFLGEISEDRDSTLSLVEECSLFFMNRAEADALYPEGVVASRNQCLCVTDGSRGVTVHQNDAASQHRPAPVDVVDPTGAGDAFAGGYLAGVISGRDPVALGFASAACAISKVGSSALIESVLPAMGPRVVIDEERVRRVAAMLAREATAASVGFHGFPFPDAGVPWALDCLAVATIHQYGFWYSDDQGWTEPMYALADGQRFKGSDFIWQAFTRAAAIDPGVLNPTRLADEPDLFEQICTADNGSCPVPQLESHRQLQQAYGSALLANGYSGFGDLLVDLAPSDQPGQSLLQRLSRLPGYGEDPLAKKANLLLLILAGRPERFLHLTDPESVTPIVDYHLMRSCLRTGCVSIIDPELKSRVEARRWIDALEEETIRAAAFDAINMLVGQSGLDQASIDGFFFTNARRNCVEIGSPACGDCPVEHACSKQVSLFQPVFRTTAY